MRNQSVARLLIVEDEGVLALDIEQHLRLLGFEVVGVAANASDALDLARERHPDLALVDIRIQGDRDGIETAQQLRSDFDVPVVYLTAHSDSRTIERAYATQPLGYLLKPFKHPDLQNVVTIAVARNAIERALRLRERMVSTTLASIGEVIVTTDERGCITFMNVAAEQLLGCLAEAGLGRSVADFIELSAEHSGERLPDVVAKAMALNAPVELQGAVLKLRSGGVRLVVGTASPVIEGGTSRGAVLVLRDLTELLAARRQLEFADRLAALGTLAAGVAHEVNNPLSYLTSNLDFAVRQVQGAVADPLEARDWPEVKSALEEAIEGARRVTRIVADLRSLTRPHLEGLAVVDPREAVRFALAVTGSEWKARARLVLELGDIPNVMADETGLGQVLVNLLINASHAMAHAGDHQLTVVTRTSPTHEAIIEVADTGVGMSEAVKERIFDPFFTTKGSGVGTGLGLSISLAIVTRFSGRIEVESTVGQGTTFRVRLPGLLPAQ